MVRWSWLRNVSVVSLLWTPVGFAGMLPGGSGSLGLRRRATGIPQDFAGDLR